MNSDLRDGLSYIESERGIDRESLLQLLEDSLRSAAAKAARRYDDVSVQIDRKTFDIRCIAKLKAVVKDHIDEDSFGSEIRLEDAQKRYPERDYKEGDIVDWEVTPESFGRIAAQTTKNILLQRLRQAEKKNICEQFKDQLGQLISGDVRRMERDGVVINFGSADGLLRREDRIPGETYEVGDMVTALLIDINEDKSGPSLLVSRSSPDFVRRLFEREVTEIADGLVKIMAVSREAGYRSKIAVMSTEQRVDPVGACVGLRGSRVRVIVRELNGEKVDIIEWSPDITTFITNALKPAKLMSIAVDEATHTVKVTVAEDQLSLSIGKKGQNARLASRLTGWKIDIEKFSNAEPTQEEAFQAQLRKAIDSIAPLAGIGEEAAEVLVRNGFASVEGIAEVDVEDIAKLPGFDHERAVAVIAAAKNTLGQ
ncbi:MAG: transcription termination/antitermination protein NusA [Victivallales bacterium]|nr:transcription termination/antitermination protein NusA [Victivallales bacterium]